MVKAELIEDLWRVIQRNSAGETIEYLAKILGSIDLARFWLAVTIKFCYENFIIDRPTYEALQRRANEIDLSNVQRLASLIENYVNEQPEYFQTLQLLLDGESINEILKKLNDEFNSIPIIHPPPSYPDEVRDAIEYYNQTEFGAMIADLSNKIYCVTVVKRLIDEIGL